VYKKGGLTFFLSWHMMLGRKNMKEIECKWAYDMAVEFKFKVLWFCFTFYLSPILIQIKILLLNEGFVLSLKLGFQLVIFVIIWFHAKTYNFCVGIQFNVLVATLI
jgi:hypothetical protein